LDVHPEPKKRTTLSFHFDPLADRVRWSLFRVNAKCKTLIQFPLFQNGRNQPLC